MNRVYADLHGPLESYGMTDDDQADELAGTVVRDTLDKLFVQEVIHPGGVLDVDVSRSDDVEDLLVLPDAFSISEYAITDHPDRYHVEVVAEHLEHEYTYMFEGRVWQSGKPSVDVDHATIEETVSVPDQRSA